MREREKEKESKRESEGERKRERGEERTVFIYVCLVGEHLFHLCLHLPKTHTNSTNTHTHTHTLLYEHVCAHAKPCLHMNFNKTSVTYFTYIYRCGFRARRPLWRGGARSVFGLGGRKHDVWCSGNRFRKCCDML